MTAHFGRGERHNAGENLLISICASIFRKIHSNHFPTRPGRTDMRENFVQVESTAY